VIRDGRLPVTAVVGSLANGMIFDEPQRNYDLTAEEIGRAALRFLGELSEQESLTRDPVRNAAGFPWAPPCRACPACRCCGTE
jgi:uncharacterized protein (DUF433 family)